MLHPHDHGPSDAEIKLQLDRIAKSKGFAASKTQVDLLTYMVAFSRNKQTRVAREIALDIFPLSDPDNSPVKVHLSVMRRNLHSYYKGSGACDPVHIDVPLGSPYRAVITYHQLSPASLALRTGLTFFSNGGRRSMAIASYCFSFVKQNSPSVAAAYGKRAESEMLWDILDHILGVGGGDSRTDFRNYQNDNNALRQDLIRAEQLGDGDVASQAVACRGATHALIDDRIAARNFFQKAMLCGWGVDSDIMQENLWYATFLLFQKEYEKALKIARKAAEVEFPKSWRNVIYAFFLYINRDYEKCVRSLSFFPLNLDQRIICDVLRGLCNLQHETPVQEDTCNPIYHAARAISDTNNESNLERSHTYRRFQGFVISSLVKTGQTDQARRLLSSFEKEPECQTIKPFQLAVAYAALGQQDAAIESLVRAVQSGDVLALQVEIWPFFDELRKGNEFEEFWVALKLNCIPELPFRFSIVRPDV